MTARPHAGEAATVRRFHRDGTLAPAGAVWVFGSNLAGRHGAGAAKIALQRFGARYGVGQGRQGMSYGIPTKGNQRTGALQVLPLKEIGDNVRRFLDYARANPDICFFVTRIGCGLADFSDAEIAPLFSDAPSNCSFAQQWRRLLSPLAQAQPSPQLDPPSMPSPAHPTTSPASRLQRIRLF